MKKYQLADMVNGPFGNMYDTLEEAEKALVEVIIEGQAINDAHAQEYADVGEDIPDASKFFEIVEIEQ